MPNITKQNKKNFGKYIRVKQKVYFLVLKRVFIDTTKKIELFFEKKKQDTKKS